MSISTERILMRIHVKESDKAISGPHRGAPLWEAIFRDLRERDLAGATVTRGIAGFSRGEPTRGAFSEFLAHDLPIVIEVIDEAARIDAIRPDLEAMIGNGIVTFERVEALIFRSSDRS